MKQALASKKTGNFTGIHEGFHGRDLMVVVGFFGLFGRVLKVVLPNVSPISVAGIFRGQHSVLWCSWFGSGLFMAVR